MSDVSGSGSTSDARVPSLGCWRDSGGTPSRQTAGARRREPPALMRFSPGCGKSRGCRCRHCSRDGLRRRQERRRRAEDERAQFGVLCGRPLLHPLLSYERARRDACGCNLTLGMGSVGRLRSGHVPNLVAGAHVRFLEPYRFGSSLPGSSTRQSRARPSGIASIGSGRVKKSDQTGLAPRSLNLRPVAATRR